MANAIAIDFGTSRIKLAYLEPGSKQPQLMRLGNDQPFAPSLFYIENDSGSIAWGFDAEHMLASDPDGIISVLKRSLERKYIRAHRERFTPRALMTHLFRDLRERAGGEVASFRRLAPSTVFLTVPALYNTFVENLMEAAAHDAGFESVKFISEPVAAARAWLFETQATEKEVVVLDCGGGTLDWAYLRYVDGRFVIVPECPPDSNPNVGGFDVDVDLLGSIRSNHPAWQTEIDAQHAFCLEQVRVSKERYCKGLPMGSLRVGGHTMAFNERDVQTVLDGRYIHHACESVKTFLNNVNQYSSGTSPVVLLVGGSARIKGLRDAIEAASGCETVWWERSEYATVLGAVVNLQEDCFGRDSSAADFQPSSETAVSEDMDGQPLKLDTGNGSAVAIVSGGATGHQPTQDSIAMLSEAQSHYDAGNIELALQKTAYLCDSEPGYARAFLMKAKIYFEKREFDAVVSAATGCIKLDPTLVTAYYYRSLAWSLLREFEKSKMDMNIVINSGIEIEKKGFLFFCRALCNTHLDMIDDAITDLKTAIESTGWCQDENTSVAALYTVMGSLQSRKGEDATFAFASALKNMPDTIDEKFGDRFRTTCSNFKIVVGASINDFIQVLYWDACKKQFNDPRLAVSYFMDNAKKQTFAQSLSAENDPKFLLQAISIAVERNESDCALHLLYQFFLLHCQFDVTAVKKDPWIARSQNAELLEFFRPKFSYLDLLVLGSTGAKIKNESMFQTTYLQINIFIEYKNGTRKEVKRSLRLLRADEESTLPDVFSEIGFMGRNIKAWSCNVVCAEQ